MLTNLFTNLVVIIALFFGASSEEVFGTVDRTSREPLGLTVADQWYTIDGFSLVACSNLMGMVGNVGPSPLRHGEYRIVGTVHLAKVIAENDKLYELCIVVNDIPTPLQAIALSPCISKAVPIAALSSTLFTTATVNATTVMTPMQKAGLKIRGVGTNQDIRVIASMRIKRMNK